MSEWVQIIRDLMREQRLSQRGLCLRARVNRNSFRRFLKGTSTPTIDFLDAVFSTLGYELDALPSKGPACQSAPQACAAAAASSDPASDAATCWNTTESGKPGSTKPGHQPANVGTTQNGSARAKPSSQQIRIAAAAVRLRLSSITSLHIVATSGSSGPAQTGNPCASPVTLDLSNAKSVADHNRTILARIAASFQVAA